MSSYREKHSLIPSEAEVKAEKHSLYSLPLKKHIFFDGVCCVGKSSLLKNLSENFHTIFFDYFERCQSNSFFLQKRKDNLAQCLYTLTFLEKLEISPFSFIDRSPLSDFYYAIILENLELLDKNMMNEMIMKLSSVTFKKFPSIIIIPDIIHIENILQKMIERDNKIDILFRDYIISQILFFTELSKINSFNKYIFIPSSIEIFSENYFNFLQREVADAIKILNISDSHIPDSHIFSSNNFCYKAYAEDAGFDLSVKHLTPCEKGKLVKIIFNERVKINEGFFGQIHLRSSTLKSGTLRAGIIDANYNGDLFTYFIPDEDMLLRKYEKFAQLVIYPCCPIQIVKDDKELNKNTGRGNKKNGSSGNFKISEEHFYQKWQRTSTVETEEEIQEYENDKKNVVFMD